ncbi:MAG: hypothetical protein AB9907_10605 [Flexilinea sp.]
MGRMLKQFPRETYYLATKYPRLGNGTGSRRQAGGFIGGRREKAEDVTPGGICCRMGVTLASSPAG